MVSFTTAVSALALLASSPFAAAETVRANRRLSYELIASYEPLSQVTDHVSQKIFPHFGLIVNLLKIPVCRVSLRHNLTLFI